MKRLLIILFLAMTAVCANAQKELNIDSIIRVEIKKLFEPEGIKNHPSYPYIILEITIVSTILNLTMKRLIAD